MEEDRVIAIYHGTEVGNMVATSSDPLLLNWHKVTGAAVIPMRQPDGSPQPYRVFDPCIWKQGGRYYSLSAGTRPAGPGGKPIRANFLLRSDDLATWEYLHPFVEDDLYTLVGDDGACPYFWPIGSGDEQRHILLFFSHMSGGQYLLGDYDTARDKFRVTYGAKFNFGPSIPAGVHAPSATPDGAGGVIVIFNMNPAKPTRGWNQIMTLPRRLTVDGDRISQQPVAALESLRAAHRRVGRTVLAANQELVLDGIGGNAMELIAEIDPGGAPMVELNVAAFAGARGVHPHRVLSRTRLPRPHSGHSRHRQPGHARQRLLVDRAGRAVARAGDGAGAPCPTGEAEAENLRRPQRGRGVRQRPPVPGGAGLSRARRQPRRVAARARGCARCWIAGPLADGQHLLTG